MTFILTTMTKNAIFLLIIAFCIFSINTSAYACDTLGCLFNGHNQDTLILGEVLLEAEDSLEIKIIFVFPQNKVRFLQESDKITVKEIRDTVNLTEIDAKTISTGKKYLMSLNKNDNFYVPAWGIYEITGTDYLNAKLVKNESIDDEALQIFINSGGTESDFFFDYTDPTPVLIRRSEKQTIQTTETNIHWHNVIAIILCLAGTSIFALLKTRK
ncbi:MAG: hypothetical protein PHU71_05670 [Candidatus Gracilibacteria bacterium]|nr:hypothetical protein [Candidatus Gracilibacteria bacterium]